MAGDALASGVRRLGLGLKGFSRFGRRRNWPRSSRQRDLPWFNREGSESRERRCSPKVAEAELARKAAKEEEEVKRFDVMEAKRPAEAESKRLAAEEAKRLDAEEAERLVEEEAIRIVEEEEARQILKLRRPCESLKSQRRDQANRCRRRGQMGCGSSTGCESRASRS